MEVAERMRLLDRKKVSLRVREGDTLRVLWRDQPMLTRHHVGPDLDVNEVAVYALDSSDMGGIMEAGYAVLIGKAAG